MGSNTVNSNYSWSSTSQWSNLPSSNQNKNNSNSGQTTQINSSGNNFSSNPPEARRDMINRLYKSILGREADINGMNYYLFNTQIPENQIAKEMYESTEHLELLNKAKDIKEILLKLDEAEKKNHQLNIQFENSQALSKSYKDLLDKERTIINHLQSQGATIDDSVFERSSSPILNQNQASQQEEHHSVLLNDPFSDDHSIKGKGCFGILKGLFKR